MLRIAAATPVIRKLLELLIARAKGLSDKAKLKDELIRNLRGESVPFSVPADHTTELEIVKFLYEKRERDELLAKLDEKIATPLQEIGAKLDEFFAEFYEPVLSDPRAEGRMFDAQARGAESLLAKAERDAFQGREGDLDFLDRFLGDPSAGGPLHRFRWALLTGPGGEGKTRLAIEFLRLAEDRLFRAGFLSLGELEKLDARRWRPRWATLLVIDYPAQSPKAVADLLLAFAQRASQSAGGLEFPVRVLLLEREAEGEWFKTVVPADGNGALVRRFCFGDGPALAHQLGALSRESLIEIMRGRLPAAGPADDETLFQALLRVDTNQRQDGDDGWRPAPRPLFAAATAEAIAGALAEGKALNAAVSVLRRQAVFAGLIDRERQHFWPEVKPPFSPDERRRQAIHENLLLLATFALDLPRERFPDDFPEPARKHLPTEETLDEERYRRMSGGDPTSVLRRLEPDLLGEFFVLDTLKRKDRRTRQCLIDAGLRLGGDASALFLIRCALDFPDDWSSLDRLRPSDDITAIRAFAGAAADLAHLLPDDRADDAAAVVSDAVEFADHCADVQVCERVAMALFNKGIALGTLGRGEDAVAAYDAVVARFGDAAEPVLRERVAMALFNKGIALGTLGRGEDAVAAYDAVVARFGDAAEPVLREQVAMALVNKGIALGALGRGEDAVVAYDAVDARFGDAAEPVLRERVARVLVNKGVVLAMLDRGEDAVATCDAVVARFGDAAEPVLREWVAMALVNKGVVLGTLGHGEEADAVCDAVVARFGDAAEPALREQVARAKSLKELLRQS